MIDKLIIYWWPDGTWVESEEYSEAAYSFKSDDFGILLMEPESSDEDIDREISQLNS